MDPREMTFSNGYLPLEILVSVLMLLSPESLVKLMGVCRSWRDLIRDPQFIRQYMKKSASKGESFVLYISRFDEQNMSFNLLKEKTFDEDSRLRIPPGNQWMRNIRIVGSFNGVLCLSDIFFYGFTIYLCNPAIWKYRIINSSTITMWLVTEMFLGFAYHSQVDDFKVVRIAYGTFRELLDGDVPHNKNDYDTRVEVYSLSSNSWRLINVASFPWYIYQSSSEVLVNGSLHWLARDGGIAGGERVILAFDLNEETFKEIFLPPDNEWEEESKLLEFLGVFQDELSVFTFCHHDYDPYNERCELWVMKEYGNEDSWSKLYTVRMEFGIDRPLKITNNAEIILIDDQERVLVYSFAHHHLISLGVVSPRSNFVTFTKTLTLIDERNMPVRGLENFLLPR